MNKSGFILVAAFALSSAAALAETPFDLETKCDLARDAKSCTKLARLYLNGAGVVQDRTQALYFFRRGCRLGDANGCLNFDLFNNPVDESYAWKDPDERVGSNTSQSTAQSSVQRPNLQQPTKANRTNAQRGRSAQPQASRLSPVVSDPEKSKQKVQD
ncbi:MAG: SEL1-like repeat protein [Succinivibrio sp.]|nr:SEL1-like repeat protein [Succinivibrio sp.]